MIKVSRIKSIKKVAYEEEVFDLSIASNNNFFACTEITKSSVLVHNCSKDVVVPIGIHLLQQKRAAVEKHAKYKSIVSEQISDTIHVFSKMETTGSNLDVKYLFHLRTSNSPIEGEIRKMTNDLMQTDAVKAANKKLCKQQGIPTKGLWGDTSTMVFSLRKEEHKRFLFFDVMGLEPVEKGASGQGKLDKHFQKLYEDVPEVKMYTALGKAKKLKTAYVNNFIKLLGTSDDLKSDYRIRPSYNYLVVVTGRTSAKDPNLQQIPARSKLGKHIKRLFIAKKGHLYIKVDYRVHEVRGWGIIAFDKALAAVFSKAKQLRDKYRLWPSPELFKRLEFEADVHIVNAMYFFSKTIDELVANPDIRKELRNAVKGVIFGLIYQMSINSLAKTIKQELNFTKVLVKNFNKKFPAGMQWIEKCKEFARKHLYFENPLGLRRHLWGYCMPLSCTNAKRIHAEMDRRAVNSPIQGMGAQFMSIGARQLDLLIFKIWRKEKRDVGLEINNSVHDSLENTSPYETFLENLNHVEVALTKMVKDEVKRRHGLDLVSDLEIDFEIGSSLANCTAWDFSLEKLEKICISSLIFQRDELLYKVDVVDAMEIIFVKGWERAPSWLKQQAKNIGVTPSRKRYSRLYKEYLLELEEKEKEAKLEAKKLSKAG